MGTRRRRPCWDSAERVAGILVSAMNALAQLLDAFHRFR
jgi:hypothetical protein